MRLPYGVPLILHLALSAKLWISTRPILRSLRINSIVAESQKTLKTSKINHGLLYQTIFQVNVYNTKDTFSIVFYYFKDIMTTCFNFL